MNSKRISLNGKSDDSSRIIIRSFLLAAFVVLTISIAIPAVYGSLSSSFAIGVYRQYSGCLDGFNTNFYNTGMPDSSSSSTTYAIMSVDYTYGNTPYIAQIALTTGPASGSESCDNGNVAYPLLDDELWQAGNSKPSWHRCYSIPATDITNVRYRVRWIEFDKSALL